MGTLAPLLLLFLVLLPFNVIAISLQSQDTSELFSVLGFQILLMVTSAAIGVACSAWARRAHLALRSAYGLVTLWILASSGAAFLSGASPLGTLFGGYTAPFYILAISGVFARLQRRRGCIAGTRNETRVRLI